MTKYRGTMEVNFSVDAENEDSARQLVQDMIIGMTGDDILRNVIIQCIDNSSSDFAKWFFKNPDMEDDDEIV